MRVVVTGAAGFIGGAVATALRADDHDVVAVDGLIPQAHPRAAAPAEEVHHVDVADADAMRPLVRGADVVVHQAAMVGAGVTPADLPLYARHNDLATAQLLALLAEVSVRRLLLASSMVVYGEGRNRCDEHGLVTPRPRDPAALQRGEFEPVCRRCSRPLRWEPVGEDAPMRPRGAYAASKVAQEHYAAAWAEQTASSVVALRYHNVYGPGMPRDTPYSGVAAIFRSALEAGQAPRVFEDGGQMRDFVHVRDVARANLAATFVLPDAPVGLAAYNVCSGSPVSVLEVARILTAAQGGPDPVVTGEFRPSDVRHIVASPDRAVARLGFVAMTPPEGGLRAFVHEPLRG